MKTASRRSLARAFLSVQAKRSRKHAVQALAALLLTQRRTKEVEYIVQEIGREWFFHSGELPAEVLSAQPLSTALRGKLETLLKKRMDAATVQAAYYVRPELKGGFLVRTPVGEIDASVARQLFILHHIF